MNGNPHNPGGRGLGEIPRTELEGRVLRAEAAVARANAARERAIRTAQELRGALNDARGELVVLRARGKDEVRSVVIEKAERALALSDQETPIRLLDAEAKQRILDALSDLPLHTFRHPGGDEYWDRVLDANSRHRVANAVLAVLTYEPCASDADPDPELLDAARQVVIEARLGSRSLVQRKLGIGFERAEALMVALEREGVVGPRPQTGDHARDFLGGLTP